MEPVGANFSHGSYETVKRYRFHDERTCAQVVASEDILFGLRCRQHDDWNPAQVWVLLDLFQRFATRPAAACSDPARSSLAAALRRDPRIPLRVASNRGVAGHLPQRRGHSRDELLAEPLWRTFDRLRRHRPSVCSTDACSPSSRFSLFIIERRQEDCKRRATVRLARRREISPPCCSTMRRQIASPIPVPSYSDLLCNRSKRAKIRS